MQGGGTRRRGPLRCNNCDQEGHVARECPLPMTTVFQRRVNAHATEDCPELIKRWEEINRKWGANLVNAEPRVVETQPLPSVAIITLGGKKTGEDAREVEPENIVKPTSPKNIFNPERQRQYIEEALETFSKLESHKDMELMQPSREDEKMTTTGKPI